MSDTIASVTQRNPDLSMKSQSLPSDQDCDDVEVIVSPDHDMLYKKMILIIILSILWQ